MLSRNRLKIGTLFIVLFLLVLKTEAQNVTISGFIKDAGSGEDLIGATIYAPSVSIGTITNSYGFYSLSLPKGTYQLSVSFLGYEEQVHSFGLQKDTQQTFKLKPKTTDLKEVVVKAGGRTSLQKQSGFASEKISIIQVREMPKMFGEADIIKNIQMQTGVKSMGDGTSGMYVRGGNVDQNMVLYDEGTLYNVSHLFGMVSVFNPEIVKDVQVYKGAFPARYGGRLSSVVDVHMQEGNRNKWTLSGGISPLGASLAGSIPIIEGKSSALLSVRKSVFDLFAGGSKQGDNKTAVPSFYDINAKINYQYDNKNRFFLSFYHGNDDIQFPSSELHNKWNNSTFTGRWNHVFSSKTFSNTSLIFNDYTNQLNLKASNDRQYNIESGIRGITLKTDFTHYLNSANKIELGIFSSYNRFIPSFNSNATENLSKVNSVSYGLYAQHSCNLSPKLNIEYGLRALAYQNIGKAFWYTYDQQLKPISKETNDKGTYTFYPRIEPRISLKFNFTTSVSAKLAYSVSHQFEQLIQNTSNAYSSFEIWIPANTNFKPQRGQILSGGVFGDFDNWEISIESYYKKFNNQIDYIDNAQLLNQPYIETQLRTGDANAYGAEFQIKKNTGRFTWSASYAYSRVKRTIEGINKGKSYSAPYDMPHDIRLSGMYKLSDRWSFSSQWTYQTGRAAQIPTGYYVQGNYPVLIYGERNAHRFPNYHRLDMSFNWSKTKLMRNGRSIKHDLSFSVYNAYARNNPIMLAFPTDINSRVIPQIVEYSFPRFIPSISYSFAIN